MKKLIIAVLLMAMPVFVWAAEIKSPKPLPAIEYAYPDQSIWTVRTNDKGELDNPLLRIAATLFSKAGIAWYGRSYPAARMFKCLQDGTSQFSMLVKSPALQECCLLSRKPVTVAEIRVYHLPGKAPVRKPADLTGKNIVTILGYSYGNLFGLFNDKRNHTTNSVVQTHAAAFKMLALHRADYVIDYAGPASEVLAMTPVPGIRWEVLSRQDVHLVLSKKYPNAPQVMARLEAIASTLDLDKIRWTEP